MKLSDNTKRHFESQYSNANLANELWTAFQGETTSAIDLFVEADGNDANVGTRNSPLRTIQAAIDRIPDIIKHPVTIHVGEGTFEGAAISGFTMPYAASASEGSYLKIQGSLIDATLATGVIGGTLTSVSTISKGGLDYQLKINNAGWTADDLKGKFIELIGGAGAGQIIPISGNTADTIVVHNGFFPVPDTTTVVAIRECGTVINTAINRPASATSSMSTASGAGVIINSINGNKGAFGQIQLKYLKFATAARSVEIAVPDQYVHIDVCRLESTGSAQIYVIAGALLLNRSSSYFATTTGDHVTLGGSAGSATLQAAQILWENGANGLRSAAAQGVIISFLRILGAKTGILLDSTTPSSVQLVSVAIDGNNVSGAKGIDANTFDQGTQTSQSFGASDVDISNCTTAVDISFNSFAMLKSTTGTGNTTGIKASRGAHVQVASTCTITGTTELDIDGNTSTLETMRAATPKHVKDSNYFTVIHE